MQPPHAGNFARSASAWKPTQHVAVRLPSLVGKISVPLVASIRA